LQDDSIDARIMRFAYLLDNIASHKDSDTISFVPDPVQTQNGAGLNFPENQVVDTRVQNVQTVFAHAAATDETEFAQLTNALSV